MFRYTSRNLDGSKARHQYDIRLGDYVECTYRRHWFGYVKELHKDGGLATVTQSEDQRGNKFRKPKAVTYHCTYFKKAMPPPIHVGPIGTTY